MEETYDQINFQHTVTDRQTPSVRIVSIFLILVFAFIPLAEVVPDFNYNDISYYSPKTTCIVGWDSLEPLSFKEIK